MSKGKTRRTDETVPSFESSLKKLESIVDQLERGEIPLDESIKMYEEGISLSKACVEKLMQAEMRIKTLAKDVAGYFQLVDGESE